MQFLDYKEDVADFVTECRHFIHQHPELPYEERQTTAFIVDALKKMGIDVLTFPDYTGCIAVIEGSQPGKTVLLRADIDALPIQERTGEPFASVHPGVMHACGHDCHAAMLLGAAKLLSAHRDCLRGRVKLLFQAAEEAFFGSHYYVDKGYLDDVDAAMGIHVWATVDQGQIVVKDGPLMASCDNFTLTVKGVSAHGSRPQEGRDAIVAASAIICGLQTAVSRVRDPIEPLVVTIGKIRSGTQFNIITDRAVMEGTVRCYDPDIRAQAEQSIRAIAGGIAAAYGCSMELDYRHIEPPTSNNDLALNALARRSAEKVFGPQGLAKIRPATGSEDFSYIMEYIPSSLFVFLGIRNEAAGCTAPAHNECFRVSDDALPAGAVYYAQFAADYLEGGAAQ